jgi:hypothetical protein
MYFKDLGVHYESNDEKDDLSINSVHIVNIFMLFMPKKYNLHDQGKINIYLNNKKKKDSEYSECLGIGSYYDNQFDLGNYLSLPPKQQDDMILSIIESSLLNIATTYDIDKKPIIEAASKVKENNYRYSFALKISKYHKSRKYRALLLLTYKREWADLRLELVTKNDEIIYKEILIDKTFSFEVYHKYKKSRWDGNRFIIFNTSDEISYEKDFTNEINKITQ